MISRHPVRKLIGKRIGSSPCPILHAIKCSSVAGSSAPRRHAFAYRVRAHHEAALRLIRTAQRARRPIISRNAWPRSIVRHARHPPSAGARSRRRDLDRQRLQAAGWAVAIMDRGTGNRHDEIVQRSPFQPHVVRPAPSQAHESLHSGEACGCAKASRHVGQSI